MEQTLLTPAQQTVLKFFAQEGQLCETYYLTGGTALAEYYLHHRDSDDLDFFTDQHIDVVALETFVMVLVKQVATGSARKERVHDRRLFFLPINGTELKIEFSRYPFQPLVGRKQVAGILIDSEKDIAANKLAALLDRFEPKDFVDLYFLLQNHELKTLCADVEKKFGLAVSPLFLAGELAKVRRVEALPRMRKPLTISELKHFFENVITGLKDEIMAT